MELTSLVLRRRQSGSRIQNGPATQLFQSLCRRLESSLSRLSRTSTVGRYKKDSSDIDVELLNQGVEFEPSGTGPKQYRSAFSLVRLLGMHIELFITIHMSSDICLMAKICDLRLYMSVASETGGARTILEIRVFCKTQSTI